MSLVTKSFGDLATYNSEDMPPPLLGKAWHKGYHAHLRHFVLSRLRQKLAVQLDFIQCPFPNQIQFGLEKIHPKNASDFPNQFQFGLERKNGILQDADSKPNSDWFGKN